MPRDDAPPFSAAVAEGVVRGDPDALSACVTALAGPLTAWLRSRTRDAQLAEDLAQETFLDLVRDCASVTPDPHSIRAWLYQAARHNLIDHRRYRGRRPEQLADEPPEPERSAPGVDELVADADESARVRQALDALSPDQADVLTLRFLGELSAPETAAVLGKTEGAVRALQHRGVAALGRLIAAGAVPIQAAATPYPVEPDDA